MVGIIYSPLIGIGLTEKPSNSVWAKAHPAHPLMASLRFHSFFSVYNCSCYSPALSMTLLRLKERGYCHANQRKRSAYSMPCTVAVFASYCPMNMRPFLPSKSVTTDYGLWIRDKKRACRAQPKITREIQFFSYNRSIFVRFGPNILKFL